MKKCPFCKADIEDNARFCLYCMKNLNEKKVILPQKKRRWLPVLVALPAIALLTGALLLLKGPADAPEQTPEEKILQATDAPAVESTEEQETETREAPKAEVVYTYRTAQAGDDFYANYTNVDGDIVITGIAQPSEDGVYDIPSHIEGKRVIAIVANAFTNSNAQSVYVPETVRSIWNYAFAGCGLTDIFFRGDSIYTESKAFPEGVTIHCSADCSNRNFRYYKDCTETYGATWEEWNG